MQTRRNFVKSAAIAAAAISAGQAAFAKGQPASGMLPGQDEDLFFKISLAQWSLNKTLFGGKLDNLDFPAYTKDNFDIHAVEYVNQFFESASKEYAKKLLQRTQDIDVKNLLIMIDGEGHLGDQDETKRKQAVENHYKWVECADVLGCHSIRVNAGGKGSEMDVAHAATKSLTQLSQFAADYGINVIVENHGGFSSRASWLASVIRNTGMVNCGTLPDFGNFRIGSGENYDLYLGMKELMPFARGVSAKSHDFDEQGDETTKDFYRILKIVKDAGFRGYIGIEYEGKNLSENEGIMATKKLLIKAGKSV
ncbi:MAG: sugar phosphate isomerase/epimerase [Bacteroidales bacterium]|nr:sugar phosphate isomerase/epimerase [Bacteroidales bacterium]